MGSPVKTVAKTTGKVVGGVADAVGDVVGSAVDIVDKVVFDPAQSFLEGVYNVVEGAVDVVDDAIANPYIRAVASIVYPPAAPYLTAYAKLDNGEDLTTTDLISLGIASAGDLGKVAIDPGIAKAVKTGAAIADGENPVTALTSNYGDSFVTDLGLDVKLNDTLTNVFGEVPANFITDNIDITSAAADLAAGKGAEDILFNQVGTDLITFAGNKALDQIGSTFGEENAQFFRDRIDIGQAAQDIMNNESSSRILANQFGDDLVGLIDSDSPNLQALGYAGIESAVAKAEGADTQQALTAGIKEYYNRDGGLPDIGSLGDASGIDWGSFDWNLALPDLGFGIPDIVGQGYDWLKDANIDFGNFDFSGLNFPDLNMDISQFVDLGGSLPDINFEGVDFGDLDLSLPELRAEGLDVNDISFGDFSFPEFATLATTVAAGSGGGNYIDTGDNIVVSLENPLLKPEEEGPLLSRKLIESAPIRKV